MTELSQRRAGHIRRLRSRKTRTKEGKVLVEGVRAATEALDAGVTLLFAVVSSRLDRSDGGTRLRDRLAESDVAEVTDAELRELSDTDQPQGVLLVCEEPRRGLEALGEGVRWLVLDAVQDPGNVGTLVRSAVAFGFDGIVCLDGTVDPWSTKAVRASAGMAFRLPVIVCTVSDMLNSFDELDTPILVASSEGGDDARAYPTLALVLGNEGAGVRQEIRAAAAETVSVAMAGPAESINVGIAGSILMYDLTRGPPVTLSHPTG